MRLLTKKEVRQDKQEERERLEKDLSRLQTAVSKRLDLLNTVKTNFDSKREKIEQDYQEAYDFLKNKIEDLKNEVASLEERKREALKPLTEKRKQLEDYKIELTAWERNIEVLEETVQRQAKINLDQFDLYTDKIDKVKILEEEIDERKRIIEVREQFLKETEIQWSNKHDELMQYFSKKEVDLIQKENDLKAKSTSYDMLMKEIEGEKQKLANEYKHIASQQASLKQAFDIAKSKGII